jgi:hypothetical protein
MKTKDKMDDDRLPETFIVIDQKIEESKYWEKEHPYSIKPALT